MYDIRVRYPFATGHLSRWRGRPFFFISGYTQGAGKPASAAQFAGGELSLSGSAAGCDCGIWNKPYTNLLSYRDIVGLILLFRDWLRSRREQKDWW